MSTDLPYPPAPAGVPPHITRPDAAFRVRVVAMIAGLFVFLLLYLVLIALAGLLAYGLLLLPMPRGGGRGTILFLVLKFGGALAAGLLAVFLVKGLFKGHKVQRAGHVILRAADHPDLFDFVRRVYQETGAPAPRHVCVSPDVNAALVYDTSLVNLFVPPRKDLLIGLGLVNVVDLVEFKAVLAHEFGHFSQRSVGLGSYLYVANQVMRDVIYGRDGLDRFVDSWCGVDVRFSFPAWALRGILWVVRGLLSALYRSLNLLHLSLGRQMEYNADNVAVSVTGSDAIIHGLARLEFANECLADASGSLDAAADRGVFSDDLFYHQTRAAERQRKSRKNDRLGLPPELPEDPAGQVSVFEAVDDGVPEKYRSHPADHMRERNAKRFYVRSPRDGRSPWVLFGDAAGLKREVTEQFYRNALDRREPYEPQPAAAVQEFIDAEHAETTYDPRYGGWYDDRFVEPGDLKELPAEAWPAGQVSAWLAGWPPADLEARVKAHKERNSELQMLRLIQSGEARLKGTSFTFRDRQCSVTDVVPLLDQVEHEVEEEGRQFLEMDRAVLLGHWSLARRLDGGAGGGPRETDLLDRYRFHGAVEGLLRGMLGEQARLQSVFGYLSNNQQLDAESFQQVRAALEQVYDTLVGNLKDARRMRAPALINVPAGATMFDLVVDRGDAELPELAGDSITGEWIVKLVGRVEGVLGRVKRLHFKSLGSLLAAQERLAAEWAAVPEATEPEGGAPCA